MENQFLAIAACYLFKMASLSTDGSTATPAAELSVDHAQEKHTSPGLRIVPAQRATKPAGAYVFLRALSEHVAQLDFGDDCPSDVADVAAAECRRWFDTGGRAVHWAGHSGDFSTLALLAPLGFKLVATVPHLWSETSAGTSNGWWATTTCAETPHEWFTVTELADGAVTLRPWRQTDISAVEPVPDAMGCAVPHPEFFADWLLRCTQDLVTHSGFHWCISDAHTGQALGGISLQVKPETPGSGHIEGFLFPTGRGRNAGVKATRLVSDWATRPSSMGGFGLHRLQAVAPASNTAGAAVLRHSGFTVFGRATDAIIRVNGRPADTLLWQRIK